MKHKKTSSQQTRPGEPWKQKVGNTYPNWNWWMSSFPPTKTSPSSFNFKAFSRSRIFLGEKWERAERKETHWKKWCCLVSERNSRKKFSAIIIPKYMMWILYMYVKILCMNIKHCTYTLQKPRMYDSVSGLFFIFQKTKSKILGSTQRKWNRFWWICGTLVLLARIPDGKACFGWDTYHFVRKAKWKLFRRCFWLFLKENIWQWSVPVTVNARIITLVLDP